MSYGITETLAFSPATHPAGSQLLALGLVFVVLVGPIIMPALVPALGYLFFIARITVSRLLQFLVDKIIEAIIVLIATFAGWLHYLDAFPALLK